MLVYQPDTAVMFTPVLSVEGVESKNAVKYAFLSSTSFTLTYLRTSVKLIKLPNVTDYLIADLIDLFI